MKHIMDRHADAYAPGSLFTLPQEKFYTELEDIIVDPLTGKARTPTEVDHIRGRVKWLEVDLGSTIGKMGVAHADPTQVQAMADYTMPGGRMEKVKVAAGQRVDTSLLSVITAPIGKLQDGREVLSLLTMFPGSNSVNGVDMPNDRSVFASKGFYFVLPEDSPALA